VVVVLAVLCSSLRVEEVVPRDELENLMTLAKNEAASQTYHGRHAPNVGTSAPLGSKNDLRRSILPRLDIIGEMMSNPTSVAEVSNFDRNDV